ncbi:non-homologous end-joining DNA ligase [Saccharothrix saharensis]|uniref:non-homologous end-joining DNA ligase n=1 Tax=Saccharothrix saharensis TaxID=571190 RepID=UPI0036C5006B
MADPVRAIDALPRIAPMLAVLGEPPADATGLAVEMKWDGYRSLAYAAGHNVRLTSRNGTPMIEAYPEVRVLSDLVAGRRVILDGEIVALDEHGYPDFGLLQQRPRTAPRGIRRAGLPPVAYYAFDLLHLDGRSLLDAPYTERRALLTDLALPGQHAIQVPPYWLDTPATLLHVAAQYDMEGIVIKKASSRYEPGRRSRSWIKVPLRRTQDVVIGGYTPGTGHRARTLGALLVGAHDQHGALRYLGHVGTGTGWTDRTLTALTTRLTTLATPSCPFADEVPRDHARDALWVRPELVGEVAFRGLTTAGRLRHPSFKGLRDDLDPRDVRASTPH